MSRSTREELLPRLRQRYVNRGRKGRSLLVDEVCEQWGYSRKHALKLLNGKAGWGGDPDRVQGRPVVYGPEVKVVVGQIWLAAEQVCGKRLKALLKLWLPYYEEEYGPLREAVRRKVLRASAATLDRLLKPMRVKHPHRGISGTRPGTLLRSQIPIRTGNGDIERPGYIEADTVAHCGESLAGDFIWSVTYTDIYSGWTATRAIWNRGQEGVLNRTREVEEELPFPILGFDSDNGGEFLNWHLAGYFWKRDKPVEFTRSRSYHKDDNGHVEQKNWTRVRQLLGYDRLEDPLLVDQINALYRDCWDPLHNLFLPSAKLKESYREGSRWVRRHHDPKTPCDRLIQSRQISAQTRRDLIALRASINPLKLKRQIEHRLRKIFTSVQRSGRPPGSLHAGPKTCQSPHLEVLSP